MRGRIKRRNMPLIVGLFLPFLLVLGPVPFLYGASWRLEGIPVAVIWLFICIPLVALCLLIASRLTDEDA